MHMPPYITISNFISWKRKEEKEKKLGGVVSRGSMKLKLAVCRLLQKWKIFGAVLLNFQLFSHTIVQIFLSLFSLFSPFYYQFTVQFSSNLTQFILSFVPYKWMFSQHKAQCSSSSNFSYKKSFSAPLNIYSSTRNSTLNESIEF